MIRPPVSVAEIRRASLALYRLTRGSLSQPKSIGIYAHVEALDRARSDAEALVNLLRARASALRPWAIPRRK